MTDAPATIVTIPSTSSASGAGGVVSAQSNYPIVLKVIHPLMVIGIRASKVYLVVLLSVLGGDAIAPSLLPASDFAGLFATGAKLAIGALVINVITNLIELLTRLDQKYPTITV